VPKHQFFQEKRLKLDAFEVEGDDGLFVTHPRMRITFWLTSDSVNVRAWLKAACVFLLLAVLDMVRQYVQLNEIIRFDLHFGELRAGRFWAED